MFLGAFTKVWKYNRCGAFSTVFPFCNFFVIASISASVIRLFVCLIQLFITRYMQPGGLWQRRACNVASKVNMECEAVVVPVFRRCGSGCRVQNLLLVMAVWLIVGMIQEANRLSNSDQFALGERSLSCQRNRSANSTHPD